MKIGKFAQIVKKRGYGIWINMDKEDGVYLSTGCSIYRADGMPNVETKEQAAAILDIEKNKLDKTKLEIKWHGKKSNVLGCDFTEGTVENEATAERLRVAAVIDGKHYAALLCENGELLFFDETWLTPLADVFKDDLASTSYTIRHRTDKNSLPYIAVKNGFITVAAIMPVKVLSDDYLGELQDFQHMCVSQFYREKEINQERELEEETENGRQADISDYDYDDAD